MPTKPKTKLTDSNMQEITKRLRAGGFLESVAREVGITSRTIRHWINRGRHELEKRERGDKPNPKLDRHVLFYMEANSAMAEAEGRAVVKITTSEDWRASAWYLERKFPKQWGRQLNVYLEEDYNRTLDKLERLLDPETYERVLEALATPDDLVDINPADIEDEDGDQQQA